MESKIRIIQSWRNVESSSFAPFTFQAPGQDQVRQEGGQEPRSQLSPPDERQHSNVTFHERHYHYPPQAGHWQGSQTQAQGQYSSQQVQLLALA